MRPSAAWVRASQAQIQAQRQRPPERVQRRLGAPQRGQRVAQREPRLRVAAVQIDGAPERADRVVEVAAPRRTRVRPARVRRREARQPPASARSARPRPPPDRPRRPTPARARCPAFASLFASPVSSSSVPAMRSRMPITLRRAAGAAPARLGSAGASPSPPRPAAGSRRCAPRSCAGSRSRRRASTTSVVAACVAVAVLRSRSA